MFIRISRKNSERYWEVLMNNEIGYSFNMISSKRLINNMVSIGIMNKQINVRLPKNLLEAATKYYKRNGYKNIQELILKQLREIILDEKEIKLAEQIAHICEKNNLYVSEEELFRSLNK
jgi:hypothetical protein